MCMNEPCGPCELPALRNGYNMRGGSKREDEEEVDIISLGWGGV